MKTARIYMLLLSMVTVMAPLQMLHADRLDRSLDRWEETIVGIIDRDFPGGDFPHLHRIPTEDEQVIVNLNMKSLVAHLDWIVYADLLESGYVSTRNEARIERQLNDLRLRILQRLRRPLLVALLNEFQAHGVTKIFRKHPLPRNLVIHSIGLILASCPDLLQ
ncbi:MAG: hypothetical protein KF799_09565 [Bdellovibrionales bacterium]|nr:hypothetical protein [Bdellovibrionales bacterium]